MHMSRSQHIRLLMRWSRGLALKELIHEAVKPGMRVLDAGSGSGILALWAAQRGADVIAVDLGEYPEAIALARCNGLSERIRFIRGDLSQVDAASLGGRVDVLLAMIYWNDPRRDEKQSRVAKGLVERCLVPGGRAIPDGIDYSAAAYDLPDQDIAQHLARARAQQVELEDRYELNFAPLFETASPEPMATWFPSRLSDGTLSREGTTRLSDAFTFNVDYSRPVSYPDSITLPAIAAGRATTVIWGQRIRSGDRTIFFNESLSWLSPVVEIARGQNLELSLSDEWRQSNILTAG